jgi:hypothetical protein
MVDMLPSWSEVCSCCLGAARNKPLSDPQAKFANSDSCALLPFFLGAANGRFPPRVSAPRVMLHQARRLRKGWLRT